MEMSMRPREMPSGDEIEAEIRDLSRKINEKRETLREVRGEEVSHKEVIHEVVHDEIDRTLPREGERREYNKALHMPTYVENLDAATQEKLGDYIAFTFEKGLRATLTRLSGEHDPYFIDLYHDVLVDALYEELSSRGEIR